MLTWIEVCHISYRCSFGFHVNMSLILCRFNCNHLVINLFLSCLLFICFIFTSLQHYFINLTSHNLIMKIVQNSFNHKLYVSHINIVHWKHIWVMDILDIRSFIGSYFICQHIYLCVKRVFNAWYLCKKCTNLWMNELHMIFIINSLHAKFVMYVFALIYHILQLHIF